MPRPACVLIAVFLATCSSPPPAAPPPNIVLILTDDQGWAGLSAQMDPSRPDSKSDYYRTPAAERLASQGMRFSNAYSPHPNCSPTRLAIQTGKSPAQLKMTDIINRGSGPFYEGLPMIPPQHIDNLPAEELTIAELIKRERPEYATAHFGKWHLAGGGPGEHGYDEHDGATGNREGEETEPNPKKIFGVTERSSDFLERMATEERPFYLQVSHYAVHLQIHALEQTITEYEGTPPGERHNHPGYAAMTTDLDTGVGMVLDKLDELGLNENTYVVYASDNGGVFHAGEERINTNQPLHGEKASVWEGGIRTPLIVRGPGIAAGAANDVSVTGMDFYPTFREWLGIEAALPEGLEGGSLAGLIDGASDSVERAREEMVWHFPHYQIQKKTTPQSAIRLGDYKLIRFYETGESRLFNLADDIGETTDLSGAEPDRAADLSARLEGYLNEIDAPMPVPNPDFK